jgi:hypothetical protein
MLGWAWYEFLKKRIRTHYVELVFLHLVGYAGQVVHPRHKMSMPYFSSFGGPDADSIRRASGHVMPNFHFCIRLDLRVK